MTYKPFDLTGKVALVTGGNGGIGLGMAEAMAASGADVAIWGTNEEKNAKAAEALKAHGTKVAVRRVDVSNEQEVIDGVDATVAELGLIDTGVANAGTGFGLPSFCDRTSEVYSNAVVVMVEGVFWRWRLRVGSLVVVGWRRCGGGGIIHFHRGPHGSVLAWGSLRRGWRTRGLGDLNRFFVIGF